MANRVSVPLALLAVLVLRGWGAHRFVHFEDAHMVAGSLSVPFINLLNDHAYAYFLPTAVAELATWAPRELIPISIFALATAVWWTCALLVWRVMRALGVMPIASVLLAALVVLWPYPDLGYQGLASGVGWPVLCLLFVMCASSWYAVSTRAAFATAIVALVAATSIPLAATILPILTWDFVRRDQWRSRIAILVTGLLGGLAVSYVVHRTQDPPLAYLGTYRGGDDRALEMLERYQQAGAVGVRAAADVNLWSLLARAPGSLRFLATQALPEPWASELILEESLWIKSIQIVAVVGICCMAPLMTRGRPTPSGLVQSGRRFLAIAASAISIEHVLVGQIGSRQYLVLPLFAVVCANICTLDHHRIRGDSRQLSFAFVLPVVAVVCMLAWQNFRDPFQENPRQGGTGRYASDDVWREALHSARRSCQGEPPDLLVLVEQFNQSDEIVETLFRDSFVPQLWFSHSMLLTCRILVQ